jgi:cell division inhibitor SulA
LHLLVCAFPQDQTMSAQFLLDFSENTDTRIKSNFITDQKSRTEEWSDYTHLFLPQFFQVSHLTQQSKVAGNCRVLEAPPGSAHISWHIHVSIARQS